MGMGTVSGLRWGWEQWLWEQGGGGVGMSRDGWACEQKLLLCRTLTHSAFMWICQDEYVEYSRHGTLLKGQEKAHIKSRFEEDVYINNHMVTIPLLISTW